MSAASKISPRLRRALILAAVSLPAGYAFGRYAVWLKNEGVWNGFQAPLVDAVSLGVALTLAAMGLITVGVSLNRKALGKQINIGEESRAATPAQARFYAGQGVVLLLAGIMMAVPPVAQLAFDPLSPLVASAAMIGLIALFLVQTVGNISMWTRSDEMLRRTMINTLALSFAILQGGLFLWAAAEKLGLIEPVSLWAAMNVLMIVYLVISVAMAVRNGFVE